MRNIAFPVIVFLAVVGCSQPEPKVAKNAEPTPPTGVSPGEQPTSDSVPGGTNAPPVDSTKPAPMDKPIIDKATGTIKIPPHKPTIEVQVPAAGTQGWKPTNIKAKDLATKMAQAVKSVRQTKLESHLLARTAEGEGSYEGTSLFIDPTTYKVDYVAIAQKPISCTIVSDGKLKMVRIDDKWSEPFPFNSTLPAANKNPKEVADAWPQDFTRMTFQGLTDGKDAWAPLFEQWSAGFGGLKPIVEERNLPYKGHMVKSYRVRAARGADAAKKLGACDIEIVVDGTQFLPVTIRVAQTSPKDKNVKLLSQWSGRWLFNQKIGRSEIKLPLPKT